MMVSIIFIFLNNSFKGGGINDLIALKIEYLQCIWADSKIVQFLKFGSTVQKLMNVTLFLGLSKKVDFGGA